MTNTRKKERLHLNSWGYNAARILSALAVIVENNGGEIQYSSHDKTYELTNRSIDNMILENENRIERAKTHMLTCKENGLTVDENKINAVIANLEKENAETLESMDQKHTLRFSAHISHTLSLSIITTIIIMMLTIIRFLTSIFRNIL